jgi:hypothetical protein
MNYSPFKLKLNIPDYLTVANRSPATGTPTGTPTDISRRDPYTLTKYVQTNSTISSPKLLKYADYTALLVEAEAKQKNPENLAPTNNSSILNDPQTLTDIVYQVSNMINYGELTLLINPGSFSIAHEKLQNFEQMVRNGNIFQSLLGNELSRITCSGKIGGYYNKNAPGGYCFFSRKASNSWQNFENLFNFYLSNGVIEDTVGNTRASHHVGYVSIFYDGWEYQGNFDTFSYGFEETEMNGGLSWDFTFTVSRMHQIG